MERAPLDSDRLRRFVGDHSVWSSIEVHESINSTNTALAARAAHGAAAGTVITAESQTAGRGRADRSWTSPPKSGLAVSMLLRPTSHMSRWSWLPLLAGVAACEAVTAAVGEVAVALKWPNDVLAGPHYHKLAGILAEVSGGGVVLGIGVNVTVDRADLPRTDATSLAIEAPSAPDRTRLLAGLLDRVGHWYTSWEAAAGDPRTSGLASAYRARCHTLGRKVTVSLPDGGERLGTAADIDGDGRLCVDTEAGRISVAAGDIRHVR
ncbi:MAG: biotin--[acetyl-CoA-carboxylase] ligase [Stackebrandtia sp.]